MLVVPREAAELGPFEAWAEAALHSGELEGLRAVSHARAPFALRATRWDVVVCDLAGGVEDARNLLREARSDGIGVPFVLIEPPVRDGAPLEMGNARILERSNLSPAGFARVIGEAASHAPPPIRVGADQVTTTSLNVGELESTSVRNADHVPAMLFRTDARGEFTHFSREWTRFTGRDETRERGRGWLEVLHPADHPRFEDAFGKALETESPFEVDLRVMRGGSEYRWLRMRAVPRRDGFVGSAFDVTDLMQRAADARQLEDDNRDLRQFTYAVAHDLQEPLRALGSWLRQAVEVAPGESIEPIGRALDTLEQTQHMVRDLLECTAVGMSGEPMSATDLREPLDWALSNLSELIQQTSAQVEVGPLGRARCDAPQIARVFQNLIGNALKFRSDDAPQVRIAAEIDAEQVRVRVRDNGAGIAATWHESIFEIFQRVPGTTADGSGVGLALCKRIVERHGGQIGVTSEPGRGSCFEFTLPAP